MDGVANQRQQREMAWGAKVSPAFRDRVRWSCGVLGAEPDDYMTCIAFESGGTFSPCVLNKAGSGAIGLIQFMPATARSLGTSMVALGRMSAEDQLLYVHKYFERFTGRLPTLADLYMAILWPSAIGKVDATPIFVAGSREYEQNRGLDKDQIGRAHV